MISLRPELRPSEIQGLIRAAFALGMVEFGCWRRVAQDVLVDVVGMWLGSRVRCGVH